MSRNNPRKSRAAGDYRTISNFGISRTGPDTFTLKHPNDHSKNPSVVVVNIESIRHICRFAALCVADPFTKRNHEPLGYSQFAGHFGKHSEDGHNFPTWDDVTLRYQHFGLLPDAKYFGIETIAPSPSASTSTSTITAPVAPSGQSRRETELYQAAVADVARRSLQQQQRIQQRKDASIQQKLDAKAAKAAGDLRTKKHTNKLKSPINSASAKSNKRVKTANHASANSEIEASVPAPASATTPVPIIATSSAKTSVPVPDSATATSVPAVASTSGKVALVPSTSTPVDDLLAPPEAIDFTKDVTMKDATKKSRSRKT
jgi:hypothetical protein